MTVFIELFIIIKISYLIPKITYHNYNRLKFYLQTLIYIIYNTNNPIQIWLII